MSVTARVGIKGATGAPGTGVSSVGSLTTTVTYQGGSNVVGVPKSANFTALMIVSRYLISANCTVTLDTSDLEGTTYEFIVLPTVETPSVVFAPNGGKTICNPDGLADATATLVVAGAMRCIVKLPDGNWLMSGR